MVVPDGGLRATVAFDGGRNRLAIDEAPGFTSAAAAWATEVASKLLADHGLAPGDVDLVVANPTTREFQDALAAGLGVAVAVVLSAKSRVHRFVRNVLTAQELHDALLLAAAAAIVLPLLPDRTIDPWGVLNLRKLWLLALLVMAINAGGHIALRSFGARRGLLLAGFAGGFASSTATIASMGTRAREHPELALACASSPPATISGRRFNCPP